MSDSGIRFIDPPQPDERILAYELSGNFTADDMRTFIEKLEAISSGGRKALLYQYMADYGSVDFDVITEKLKNLGTIWRAVEKIAVVGDARWLEIYIGIVDHLTPQQMKYFEPSEKAEAFAWLTA